MSEFLEVAKKAAQIGGEVILKYYHTDTEMRYKGTSNLVSDADLETEEAVVSFIKQKYADHGFLGEETYKDTSKQGPLWIIDPLDGTTNFAHRIPQIACSVAFFDQGSMQAGAVFNPVTGDLFEASKGGGAFWNSKQIHVSKASSLKEALIATGFHYDRSRLMENTLHCIKDLFHKDIHGIRRYGTASLDLCFLAMGRFDAYIEYQLNPWDFAAGALIVKEAGGEVTDAGGVELGLETSSVLASNGALYGEVLEIAKKHVP